MILICLKLYFNMSDVAFSIQKKFNEGEDLTSEFFFLIFLPSGQELSSSVKCYLH